MYLFRCFRDVARRRRLVGGTPRDAGNAADQLAQQSDEGLWSSRYIELGLPPSCTRHTAYASSWSTILLDGLDLWHLDPLGLGPSVPHTLNHRRDHGQTRTSDIDHGTDVHTVFLGVRDRAKIYFT